MCKLRLLNKLLEFLTLQLLHSCIYSMYIYYIDIYAHVLHMPKETNSFPLSYNFFCLQTSASITHWMQYCVETSYCWYVHACIRIHIPIYIKYIFYFFTICNNLKNIIKIQIYLLKLFCCSSYVLRKSCSGDWCLAFRVLTTGNCLNWARLQAAEYKERKWVEFHVGKIAYSAIYERALVKIHWEQRVKSLF